MARVCVQGALLVCAKRARSSFVLVKRARSKFYCIFPMCHCARIGVLLDECVHVQWCAAASLVRRRELRGAVTFRATVCTSVSRT